MFYGYLVSRFLQRKAEANCQGLPMTQRRNVNTGNQHPRPSNYPIGYPSGRPFLGPSLGLGLQCLAPLLLCPADSSEPKSRISSLPSASALRKNCNIPAGNQPSAPRQLPPSRSLPNAPQTPRGTDAGSDLGLCPGTCEAFSASDTPLVSPARLPEGHSAWPRPHLS